jgi:hypothetical protein
VEVLLSVSTLWSSKAYWLMIIKRTVTATIDRLGRATELDCLVGFIG